MKTQLTYEKHVVISEVKELEALLYDTNVAINLTNHHMKASKNNRQQKVKG